jgi:hypothetical protein
MLQSTLGNTLVNTSLPVFLDSIVRRVNLLNAFRKNADCDRSEAGGSPCWAVRCSRLVPRASVGCEVADAVQLIFGGDYQTFRTNGVR